MIFKADYRQWKNIIKTEIMKPDKLIYPIHRNHFHDETTYSYDYIPLMNQTPRSIIKPDKSILRSAERFDHKSGYSDEFTTPDKNKNISFKPDTLTYNLSIPTNGLFDSTANSLDSLKWRSSNNFKKDLRTSYNLDFTKKKPTRPEPIKPFVKKSKQDDKFESDSTYSLDYRRWSGENKRFDLKSNKFIYW